MLLPPFHVMSIVFGLIVWAVFFVVIYGGIGIVCGVAPPPVEQGPLTWINLVMGLVGILFTLYLAWGSWHCWKHAPRFDQGREHDRFIARIAAFVYAFAALSTFAVTLPVVLYPPCV
jgi:hypothetical protein